MLNAAEVRVAPFGHIYVAQVGADAPTDTETPFGPDWFALGYVDEDGVNIAPSLETTDFNSWQSLTPIKTSATSLSLDISFVMQQINTGTTSLFFFGAEWEESEPGIYKLAVTSDQLLEERALGVEWRDDAGNRNRLIVPRGFVSERENLQLQRNALTTLGVTFKALDNSGEFFELISDNTALAPDNGS